MIFQRELKEIIQARIYTFGNRRARKIEIPMI